MLASELEENIWRILSLKINEVHKKMKVTSGN